MGYEALLFCPDEKLARIVAQVFSELEFNVEPVQEPFSAVKKLMAQRFDALVVDCENDSNASLLFKSARNSSANQGTLAIAVVEGQAGVAKAYRIGANLVLTKPINVEQAKGTLRVARGLLRKNAEAAPVPANPLVSAAPRVEPAPAAATASAAPASIPAPTKPTAIPTAPPKVARELPEFEPVTPAIAASAAETPVAAAPIEEAPATKEIAAEMPIPVASPALAETKPAATLAPVAATSAASVQGAAVAPAKVKEAVPPKTHLVEFEPPSAAFEPQAHDAVGSTPSFSVDLDDSGSKGGKQKILMAAVVVLAVAAVGYFGWTKMSSRKPEAPAAQTVSVTPQPSRVTPALAPISPLSNSAPAGVTNQPAVTTEPAVSKPTISIEPEQSVSQPAQTVSQPTIRLQIAPEPGAKVATAAPLKVKSSIAKNTKAAADDSSAPLPSTLAVDDANSSALNSVVAAPSATAKPSLASLKISQGVSQGLLIKRVDPKYPASALTMHVQGAVLLDATINREGMISDVSVVKGDKVLARAATDAVKQWRYKPYYLDGQPVEIQTQITINFKLPN